MNGIGKYTTKDGLCFNGEWNENKMHGKGIYTWPDGRMYEGEYL